MEQLINEQIKFLQETYNLKSNEPEFANGEIQILNKSFEQRYRDL